MRFAVTFFTRKGRFDGEKIFLKLRVFWVCPWPIWLSLKKDHKAQDEFTKIMDTKDVKPI